MKTSILLPSALLGTIAMLALTAKAAAATLTGLWLFDTALNPAQATVGNDLSFEGVAPTYSASLADDGATVLSGVMTTAAATSANRIRADHGIAPNGGGAFVNQYTIVADIFSPVGSRGSWRTLYQTSPTNGNDGEYFIRNSDDALGVAALTYGPAINEAAWTRWVLTVDLSLAGNDAVAYLDGSLHFTHPNNEAVDGRFSLDPFLFFFTDEDGDNAPLNVGALAIFNGVLTPAEVTALGRAGTTIPEPAALALFGLAAFAGLARRRR